MEDLARWLEANGYARASIVRDVGDYASRGGILDLYPPGATAPIRLDFFGDTLESIRAFDPETQRSTTQQRSLDLVPMSEARLTTESIRRFRQTYAQQFGAPAPSDDLYAAVSEGRRAIGLEHWLPLLYDSLDTLFDYVGDAPFVLDARADDAAHERIALIADNYAARRAAYAEDPGKADYKPLPAARLYLTEDEWKERLAAQPRMRLTPFEAQPGESDAVDCGGRTGRNFGPERQNESANVFDAAVAHVRALRGQGLNVIVAGWSDGSRERLSHVLAEHGLKSLEFVSSYHQAATAPAGALPLAVIALEQGFEAPDFAIIGEQDILGDRLVRRSRRRRRAQDVLAEASALAAGDLVVHIDHGVGRFVGLKTIEAAGAPHDCLEIHYAGGDRLFLPVENLELLSRYGSETGELDKLGGAGWQSRKARLKKRVREMAGELIRVAAQRMTHAAPRLTAPDGLYDEFSARFPYDETPDQASAIEATLDDLAAGRPMDRLVCGDVGFGKTEVALRAAFAAAINGKQTAIIAPTTLLARQHTLNFRQRFAGLPVNIGQLSRMVGASETREVKKGLAEGQVDIVVGTHAVLRQDRELQGPRPRRRRRGAAFRRRPQGAAEGTALGSPCADAFRHPDPAHPATGDDRRARDVDHRDTADRPSRGAHLRLALRCAHRSRGSSARALSRRTVVLCLPAHRGPRRGGGVPASERARVQIRRCPRADGLARARGQGRRLLRRQVRHPLVDGDRRIRASTFRAPTP